MNIGNLKSAGQQFAEARSRILESIAQQYAEARFNHVTGTAMQRLERELLDEIAKVGWALNYDEQVAAYKLTPQFARETAQLDKLLDR